MGDHAAVDFALESHVHLLQWLAGVLEECHWVNGGEPRPAADLQELLVIDDHVVLWKALRGVRREDLPRRPDLEVMARSTGAYRTVGLQEAEDKVLRGEPAGIAIGAEVLGDLGTVAAPRSRRLGLSTLSVRAAAHDYITVPLLQSVDGVVECDLDVPPTTHGCLPSSVPPYGKRAPP